MPRPDVCLTAEDLYASFGCYSDEDEALDWPLLKACDAYCLVFVEPIAELVQERDGRVPFEILFSPALTPYPEYVAQYEGIEFEPELTDEEKRDKLTTPEGFFFGTTPSRTAAVQRTLTGTKHVVFDERADGHAYRERVRTQIAETPEPTLVERQIRWELDDLTPTEIAVLSQKPVGTVCFYQSITGATYDEVDDAYASYTAVAAGNANYSALLLLPV